MTSIIRERTRLPPRPRVIYILGHSHSGSTVLDIVLGSHPQVVSVGELINLVQPGLIDLLYCSCGERGDVCPFWADVRRRWRQLAGGDDLERYLDLQQRFERIRRLPLELLLGWRPDPRFLEYARLTACLFTAVEQVAGKAVVVDSSKSPGRALALARASEIDVVIVHIVRDARGVAWSLKRSAEPDPRRGIPRRRLPQRPASTALSWILHVLLGVLVRRASGAQSVVLRYEDFVTSPATALSEVGRLAGLDYEAVGASLERGEDVPVSHCISGNRVRMTSPLRLQLDDVWTRALSTSERRHVWLLAGWLLRLYGYRR